MVSQLSRDSAETFRFYRRGIVPYRFPFKSSQMRKKKKKKTRFESITKTARQIKYLYENNHICRDNPRNKNYFTTDFMVRKNEIIHTRKVNLHT